MEDLDGDNGAGPATGRAEERFMLSPTKLSKTGKSRGLLKDIMKCDGYEN